MDNVKVVLGSFTFELLSSSQWSKSGKMHVGHVAQRLVPPNASGNKG